MNRSILRASVSLTLLLGSMFACSDEDVPPGAGARSDAAPPIPNNPGPPPNLPDGAPNPEYDGGTIGVNDFDIAVIADGTLVQNKPFEVAIKVTRKGYAGAITLKADSLPDGVGVGDIADIAAGSSETILKLTGAPMGAQGPGKVKLSAKSADGKIAKTTEFALYVKGAPGTLDKTFGSNGYAVIPATVGAKLRFIQQDAIGRIYLGAISPLNEFELDTQIVRFANNGSIDTSYGMNGTVAHTGIFGTNNEFAVDLDGNVYGVRSVSNGVGLMRFLPTGQTDASFNYQEMNYVIGGASRGSATYNFAVSLSATNTGIAASIWTTNIGFRLFGTPGSPPSTNYSPDTATLRSIDKATGTSLPSPLAPTGAQASFMDGAGRFYYLQAAAGTPNSVVTRFPSATGAALTYQTPAGALDSSIGMDYAVSASGKLALWRRNSTGNSLVVVQPSFAGAEAGYPRAFPTSSSKDMTFDSSEFIVTLVWNDAGTFTINREAAGVADASFTAVPLSGSAGNGRILAQPDRKIVFATTNSAGTAVQLGRLWN
jgi:hypothetical protein